MIVNHIGTQTIITERLILRRYTESDAEPIYNNLFSDNNTAYYMTWTKWKQKNMEQVKRIIKERVIAYNSNTFYRWVITLKDGTQIGEIGVNFYDNKTQTVRIGYSLGSKWWDNGYMTESAKAVIDYLFHRVGIKTIEAYHRVDNKRSNRVMVKCGMHYVNTEEREIVIAFAENKKVIFDRYRIENSMV